MKILILTIYLVFSSYLGASETGFLAFGDTGTGEPTQYRVADSMSSFCQDHLCQFVALLGDNFYPAGVSSVKDSQWKKSFEEPYKNLAIPFFASLGNHDYDGNIKAQIEYTNLSKYWKMPSRYYQYSQGEVDFFVLDTNNFNKKQQDWLKTQLEKSDKTWRIVYGHHPIYSYGDHGNSEELEDSLLPILEDRVDFYLFGHDHNKQIIRKKSSEITFIVSGAAAKSEPIKKNRAALYTSGTLGFAHFLVTETKAVISMVNSKGKIDFAQAFEPRN